MWHWAAIKKGSDNIIPLAEPFFMAAYVTLRFFDIFVENLNIHYYF